MPLFLCNPTSSFYYNLIQLSPQQMAVREACTPALLSLLPFPLTPHPLMAPQTAALMLRCLHPHLIASSFFHHLLQNVLFSLIYVNAVEQDLSAERLLHLLLFHVHHFADKGTWTCSPVGFSVYPEAHGSSNICKIPALSILVPNCINSVA